jgi:hypothetical protein
MMTRIFKQRGVNVIAMVLMLITFFLVIGFGIGALATMNLNLSGRSISSVKSNQLAEAAVAQFLKYVQKKAETLNASVTMEDLAPAPLELDKYYDGIKNIFEPPPAYMGDQCSADVHFKILDGQDHFYSTDNLNGTRPLMGARGLVPPLTLELVVNVTVGSSLRHYQVFITRKWDYVLYCEEGPVYLTNCFDPRNTTSLIILKACSITGSIFSKFCPNPYPATPYPDHVFVGKIPTPDPTVTPPETIEHAGMDLALGSYIPGKNIPASIFVGGPVYIRSNLEPEPTKPPNYSYAQLYTSEGNLLNGKGVYSFPSPTPSPGTEKYVYLNNNNTSIRKSTFNSMVTSPIDNLKPLDDDKVACETLDKVHGYPFVRINSDYYGPYRDSPGPEVTPVTVTVDGTGTISNPTEKSLYDTFKATFSNRRSQYAAYRRPVFWVEHGFKTVPAGVQNYQWGEKARFVVKDSTDPGIHSYLPLVDMYKTADCTIDETVIENYGAGGKKMQYKINEIRNQDFIDVNDKKICFDNSMIVARNNLEFTSAEITGDNTMLQVDGNVTICAGKISAGKTVGTVVFCNNLYCGSSGSFNGIIFAKKSIRIGNGNGTDVPTMKGAIICKGEKPDKDPTNNALEDGGIVCSGLNLTYDASYMKVLSRFGKFRVTCWREIN